MTHLFPYDNIVVGILLLIVGFIFHWIGQLISVLNWRFATDLGLQEEGLSNEYKAYEHAIAKADVAIGWVYGVISVGLFLDVAWSYDLLWIPGAILVYHGISYWFWTGNRKRNGHDLVSGAMRITWVGLNLTTGALAIALAMHAG